MAQETDKSPPVRVIAAERFQTKLEEWLQQEEAEATLDGVSRACPEVSAQAVHDTVERRWTQVEELLEPALKRWTKAEERLLEAQGGVEKVMPTSRLRWTAIRALVGAALLIAAIVWLGLNFDPDFFLGGFILLLVPIRFLDAWSKRNIAKIELAVAIREKEIEKAREAFDAALEDQVKIAVREVVNGLVISFQKKFRIFDQTGLRELADREREVPTRSSAGLSRLLTSLDSGSIGLAGPRGSGKTTLIYSFARGRSLPIDKERIGLVVSAPVKYDAREFILHLFASLCKRVLGEDSLEEISRLNWQTLVQQRKATLSRAVIAVGFLLMMAAAAILLTGKTSPEGPQETSLFLGILGLAGVYLGFFALMRYDPMLARKFASFLVSTFGFEEPEKPQGPSPEQLAQARLEEIQFQQSVSSNWSGGLKMPLGMNLSGDSTATLARTPWTLPEAVDEFRNFAARHFDGRYIVIGIDELDKMESDEAAREFLNDVKGVFGVRNCYYLVSVSEDAMSTFERRGLPFRDVFDSSFDAIEQVEYLTLDESRMVLESRVTGLPIPFQCLCHSLSGGLPRDLIRVTRELVQLSGADEENEWAPVPSPTVGTLAAALVADEHRRKMAAAIAAVRPLRGARREWLARWLSAQRKGPTSPKTMREWASELSGWAAMADDDDEALRAREIAAEVALLGYYGATVIELYGQTDIDQLLRRWLSNRRRASAVEQLAVARQQFSISPGLAWSTVDGVQRRMGNRPWSIPRQSRGFSRLKWR